MGYISCYGVSSSASRHTSGTGKPGKKNFSRFFSRFWAIFSAIFPVAFFENFVIRVIRVRVRY